MIVTPAPGVGPHSPTSRTPHPLAVRTRVYDPRSPLPGPAPSPLRAGVGADHTPQLRATPSPQRPSGGLRFPAWTQTPGRVVGGRVPVRTGLVRIPPPPPTGGSLPALGPAGGGCGLRESGGSRLIPTPETQVPPAAPRPCPRHPLPWEPGPLQEAARGGPPSPQAWTQRGPKLGESFGCELGGGEAGGRAHRLVPRRLRRGSSPHATWVARAPSL